MEHLVNTNIYLFFYFFRCIQLQWRPQCRWVKKCAKVKTATERSPKAKVEKCQKVKEKIKTPRDHHQPLVQTLHQHSLEAPSMSQV